MESNPTYPFDLAIAFAAAKGFRLLPAGDLLNG